MNIIKFKVILTTKCILSDCTSNYLHLQLKKNKNKNKKYS